MNAGFNWDPNPVPLFLGGGWLSQGLLPGQGSETALELNYSWLVDSNLSLQPVLQLILNPDGSNAEPILAAGVGLELQF